MTDFRVTVQRIGVPTPTSNTDPGVSRLVNLTDVDATISEEGDTLVYDETVNKYVVKKIPIINGGDF